MEKEKASFGNMIVERLEDVTIGNAFNSDSFHMGTKVGKNVTIMFSKHISGSQPYIIVVNTDTGERIHIILQKCKDCIQSDNINYVCGNCGGRNEK